MDALKRLRELDELIKRRMSKVKHKVAVLSGKGGVGKSTVTANLALAIARRRGPGTVGILDADITGASIPKLLNTRGEKLVAGPPGIIPVKGPLNVKVVSMDYLLPDDETPVIWRGPMKTMAIKQFLAEVAWGELEYLFIDLPPGTGDEALTIAQSIPGIDGAVIVTIPSEVSQIVVKRAIGFCRRLNLSVIGVVENMSVFVCPRCGYVVDIFGVGGGEKIARDMGVVFLGKIPLDPEISRYSDTGTPIVIGDPDSPVAKAFEKIAHKVEEFFKTRG